VTGISAAEIIEPEAAPIAASPPEVQDKGEARAAASEPAVASSTGSAARSMSPAQPKADPLIPLVHAPDDPGPESVEDSEPQVEPPTTSWRKIFE